MKIKSVFLITIITLLSCGENLQDKLHDSAPPGLRKEMDEFNTKGNYFIADRDYNNNQL